MFANKQNWNKFSVPSLLPLTPFWHVFSLNRTFQPFSIMPEPFSWPKKMVQAFPENQLFPAAAGSTCQSITSELWEEWPPHTVSSNFAVNWCIFAMARMCQETWAWHDWSWKETWLYFCSFILSMFSLLLKPKPESSLDFQGMNNLVAKVFPGSLWMRPSPSPQTRENPGSFLSLPC